MAEKLTDVKIQFTADGVTRVINSLDSINKNVEKLGNIASRTSTMVRAGLTVALANLASSVGSRLIPALGDAATMMLRFQTSLARAVTTGEAGVSRMLTLFDQLRSKGYEIETGAFTALVNRLGNLDVGQIAEEITVVARTTGASQEDIARAVTQLARIFGANESEIIDGLRLIEAGLLGAAGGGEQLLGAILELAPAAFSIGISLEQLIRLVVALDRAGLDINTSVSVLQRLISGIKTGKIEELGLAFDRGKKGIDGIIDALNALKAFDLKDIADAFGERAAPRIKAIIDLDVGRLMHQVMWSPAQREMISRTPFVELKMAVERLKTELLGFGKQTIPAIAAAVNYLVSVVKKTAAVFKWLRESIIGNVTTLAMAAVGGALFYGKRSFDKAFGIYSYRDWTVEDFRKSAAPLKRPAAIIPIMTAATLFESTGIDYRKSFITSMFVYITKAADDIAVLFGKEFSTKLLTDLYWYVFTSTSGFYTGFFQSLQLPVNAITGLVRRLVSALNLLISPLRRLLEAVVLNNERVKNALTSIGIAGRPFFAILHNIGLFIGRLVGLATVILAAVGAVGLLAHWINKMTDYRPPEFHPGRYSTDINAETRMMDAISGGFSILGQSLSAEDFVRWKNQLDEINKAAGQNIYTFNELTNTITVNRQALRAYIATLEGDVIGKLDKSISGIAGEINDIQRGALRGWNTGLSDFAHRTWDFVTFDWKNAFSWNSNKSIQTRMDRFSQDIAIRREKQREEEERRKAALETLEKLKKMEAERVQIVNKQQEEMIRRARQFAEESLKQARLGLIQDSLQRQIAEISERYEREMKAVAGNAQAIQILVDAREREIAVVKEIHRLQEERKRQQEEEEKRKQQANRFEAAKEAIRERMEDLFMRQQAEAAARNRFLSGEKGKAYADAVYRFNKEMRDLRMQFAKWREESGKPNMWNREEQALADEIRKRFEKEVAEIMGRGKRADEKAIFGAFNPAAIMATTSQGSHLSIIAREAREGRKELRKIRQLAEAGQRFG